MIVPENRVAMAPSDQEESMNSTIIRSLLCPKSATVISDIRTGQVHILHRRFQSSHGITYRYSDTEKCYSG